MEPPMDLISKLKQLHRLAWRDLNIAVSLSLKLRCANSVVDAFQVCCANGFLFASHLGDLRFHISDWLHDSIHCTRFSALFSKLSV